MRILLDAHTLAWALFEPGQIGAVAAHAITASANEVLVSPISIYELELKRRSGKLPMPQVPDWSAALSGASFTLLGPTMSDYVTAAHLPFRHRDPWDRLLIAQAISNSLTVATKDRIFPDYGVPVIW